MTVIFVRHGDDNGSNPSFTHDPRVTKRGKKKAQIAAYELVERYGSPTAIFCSPFRRTLETAKQMREMCDSRAEIYIDNNLSRYFCRREKANPEISEKTEKYNVPIYEEWRDFEKRINKHLRMLKKRGYVEDEEIVWIISHALVYKHVARVYGIDIPVIIPFMDHFLIHKYSIELPRKAQERRRREDRRKKREYFKSKRNKKRSKKYM